MKINKDKQQKLYNLLDEAINYYSYTASLDDLRAHRKDNSGHDKEKRFRFDLFYMARRINPSEFTAFIDELYKDGVNDEHIDTVLRQYVDKRPQLSI
jgi:hypothetical protein